MNIIEATRDYETWLGQELHLIPADLRAKHQHMAEAVFPFLRATFYRWMQLWQELAKDLNKAPEVLAVGDLHVENFGTWRDREGRLVWGINDFDEACELPYTLDLARLAVSAHVAIADAHLSIAGKSACEQILAGYRKSLEVGGKAIVLAEDHAWLRHLVTGVLRDPERFWAKLDGLKALRGKIPPKVVRSLDQMMPERGLECRLTHRIAGLGSLGRERFVAVAMYRGARVAREAKALAPPAAAWAGAVKSRRIRYQEILDGGVRSADPFVHTSGKWIVRRLAPDCSRVELSSMPKERDESKLLMLMGHETANIHLGSAAAKRILKDLDKRPADWLHEAAGAMLEAVRKDWEEWRGRKA